MQHWYTGTSNPVTYNTAENKETIMTQIVSSPSHDLQGSSNDATSCWTCDLWKYLKVFESVQVTGLLSEWTKISVHFP